MSIAVPAKTERENRKRMVVMKQKRLLEQAALAAMALSVLLSVLGFGQTCGKVRASVLRLHVVANSDSAADQSLKLAVRDAILKAHGGLFAAAKDKAQAVRAARYALPELEQTAQGVLARQGSPYAVHVSLGQSIFPTRTYGSVTLPAGTYDAVKVTLGSGGGHNWWCVMFPPLCLPAACEGMRPQDVLPNEAFALVQEDPQLEMRFWLVEKWEELKVRFLDKSKSGDYNDNMDNFTKDAERT